MNTVGNGSGMHPPSAVYPSPDCTPLPYFIGGEGEENMKVKTKNPDYKKRLLDPRWQKMRLEILNRDEFTCQSCGDSESTLHVHHRYYISGNMPWEYSPKALITLCYSCHDMETQELNNSKQRLIRALSHWGFSFTEFDRISEALENSEPYHCPEPSSSILAFAISNPDCRKMVSDMFWNDCAIAANKIRGEE